MHLELYRALPHCGAVLHSHPRRLLALSLVVAGQEDFLRLPLFEADVWRARLGFAPALPPGGAELALAVADAARAVGADQAPRGRGLDGRTRPLLLGPEPGPTPCA